MFYILLFLWYNVSWFFGGDNIRTLEDVRRDICILEDRISSDLLYNYRTGEDYRGAMKRLNGLRDEALILSSERIAYSDEIDIYEKKFLGKKVNYFITIHDSYEIVGYVQVNYNDVVDPFYGNVGYEIKEEYRGHSYAYKALELLSSIMVDRGLVEPLICIKDDNYPSISTAKKFGARVVKASTEIHPYSKYSLDLRQKVKSIKYH